MSGEALISFVGNACGDAELRYTAAGVAVAGWTVAVAPRTKRNDEWVDGETAYYRCNAWRQRAEPSAETITKGMRVTVTGKLTTRTYETTAGEKRMSLEVDVDSAGPDLLFATAKVSKVARGSDSPAQGRSGTGSPPADDPWSNVPPPDSEMAPF